MPKRVVRQLPGEMALYICGLMLTQEPRHGNQIITLSVTTGAKIWNCITSNPLYKMLLVNSIYLTNKSNIHFISTYFCFLVEVNIEQVISNRYSINVC